MAFRHNDFFLKYWCAENHSKIFIPFWMQKEVCKKIFFNLTVIQGNETIKFI